MKTRLIVILLAVFSVQGFSQISDPSVNIGLVYTDPPMVTPGYTAVAPRSGSNTYLLDNCGKIVNQWSYSNGFNEACAYITQNGECAILVSNNTGGGAVYGNSCIEVKSWNDNLVWNYCPTGEYVGMHNDIVPLPNGNYLAIVQKTHTVLEALENGYDIANIGQNNSYKSESIVEFQPLGTNNATIVWEWNIWDHLIQDHNPSVANYGVVADHPEKYDINVDIASPATGASFTHINSVEYDEQLDIILVSMFSIHEIFIIDHSTTMAESAGDTGGNFGKGGGILYRWGNPQNYDRGGPADRQLYGQHDARWIPPSYVNAGKISIFNNDGGNQSEIVVIDPSFDANGQFALDPVSNTYLPNTPFYTWRDNIWTYPPPSTLFTSGVAPLQNGGFLVHDASQGIIGEIAPNDDVVWVYRIPGWNTNQGSNSVTSAFKVRKYLPSYAGFVGRDMSSNGYIESDNVVSDACSLVPTCNLSLSINGLPTTTSDSTPLSLSGSPAGGTFSGTGVVFNAFNPSIAGAGIHTITYTYDDGNGCIESYNQNILVFSIVYNFVNYSLGTISPRLTNTIDVNFEVLAPGNFNVQLMDVNGQMLYSNDVNFSSKGTHQTTLEVPNLKAGSYFINMTNDRTLATKKILIH